MQQVDRNLVQPFPTTQRTAPKREDTELAPSRKSLAREISENLLASTGVLVLSGIVRQPSILDEAFFLVLRDGAGALAISCILRWFSDEAFYLAERIRDFFFPPKTVEGAQFEKMFNDNVNLIEEAEDRERAYKGVVVENNQLRQRVAVLKTTLSNQPAPAQKSKRVEYDPERDGGPVIEIPHQEHYSPEAIEEVIASRVDPHTQEQSRCARRIIHAFAKSGSISKRACKESDGLTQTQWEKGITFLESAGVVGEESGAKVMLVDIEEAYRREGNKIGSRVKEQEQENYVSG